MEEIADWIETQTEEYAIDQLISQHEKMYSIPHLQSTFIYNIMELELDKIAGKSTFDRSDSAMLDFFGVVSERAGKNRLRFNKIAALRAKKKAFGTQLRDELRIFVYKILVRFFSPQQIENWFGTRDIAFDRNDDDDEREDRLARTFMETLYTLQAANRSKEELAGFIANYIILQSISNGDDREEILMQYLDNPSRMNELRGKYHMSRVPKGFEMVAELHAQNDEFVYPRIYDALRNEFLKDGQIEQFTQKLDSTFQTRSESIQQLTPEGPTNFSLLQEQYYKGEISPRVYIEEFQSMTGKDIFASLPFTSDLEAIYQLYASGEMDIQEAIDLLSSFSSVGKKEILRRAFIDLLSDVQEANNDDEQLIANVKLDRFISDMHIARREISEQYYNRYDE